MVITYILCAKLSGVVIKPKSIVIMHVQMYPHNYVYLAHGLAGVIASILELASLCLTNKCG